MNYIEEFVSIEYHTPFDNISRTNDCDPLNGVFWYSFGLPY